MTAVTLGPKNFQELVFKAVKNRKRRGQFLQTKATHFETMMTTADEVNRDKTKVPD